MNNNLSAAGMFIGMVIGVGFFSLPYSISRVGLGWGLIYFIITFLIILFLHLLYGFIVFSIPKNHRFTGYVKILLGKRAEKLALLNIIFTYYGAFIAYSILAGFFIFNLFPFTNTFNWTLFFLILCSFFIFSNFKKIGEINFYLTFLLLLSVVLFLFLSIKKIHFNNFLNLNKSYGLDIFLPYGVFLFSFSGFSVIPEVCDFFREKNKAVNKFKKTIKISQIIIALFYLIFIISILGILGKNIEENIFYSIKNIVGKTAFLIITLTGFLAILTSMLALISDFRSIFLVDYKISKKNSWFLFLFPILIFLFLTKDILSLTNIISIVGGIGFGIFGLFILFMAKKIKNNKNIYSVWKLYLLIFFLILGVIIGVFNELRKILLF